MIRLALAALCLVALAAPAHAHCHDASHVLGYAHCRPLGAWWSRDVDIARFRVDEGWLNESFMPRPFTLPGATAARADMAAMNTRSPVTGNGMSARWLIGGRILYGGFEYSALFFTPPALAGFSPSAGVAFQPLGIFGAHASLWLIGLNAEVAAGPRFELFGYCGADPSSCNRAVTQASQIDGVVDARVSAELFFQPMWSVGVLVGQNALDAHDHSVGVFLGIHIRPFDGMY